MHFDKEFMPVGQRLQRNAELRHRIDIFTVTLGVALPIMAISAALRFYWGGPAPAWANVLAAIVVGIIVAYPFFLILGRIARTITEKLAPTWVIDTSEPAILKVAGTISFGEWEAVEMRLLNERPRYMPVEDAKPFSCVMAAIPADDRYRRRMEAMGRLQRLGLVGR